MKNLNYLACIEIDEYDLIKRDKIGRTKTRLDNIRVDVNVEYQDYINHFDTIHNKAASTFAIEDTTALKGCYSIKTKARDKFLIINHFW